MMKRTTLAIADVYVPVKRRATLEQKRAAEIAASILDKGLQTSILVRADGARVVLVAARSVTDLFIGVVCVPTVRQAMPLGRIEWQSRSEDGNL